MDDLDKKLALMKEIRKPNIIYYAVFPVTDMLLVLFVAFKLAGIGKVGSWPWMIVLLPLWFSLFVWFMKKYIPIVQKYLKIEKF